MSLRGEITHTNSDSKTRGGSRSPAKARLGRSGTMPSSVRYSRDNSADVLPGPCAVVVQTSLPRLVADLAGLHNQSQAGLSNPAPWFGFHDWETSNGAFQNVGQVFQNANRH